MTSRSTPVVISLLFLAACGGGSSTAPPEVQKMPDPVITRIVVYAGNDQVGNRGGALGDPLCTNVLDQTGRRMLGVAVTYTVATGGGAVAAPNPVLTDGSGIATSGTWTLGPNAGAQTVVASAAPGVTVTFRAVAN